MGVKATLAALDDPVRRRILGLLSKQVMSAGELAQAVGLAPSRLSYHLAKLKDAGLVSSVRRGSTRLYESNLTVLDETIVWLRRLQGDGDSAEDGDERDLGGDTEVSSSGDERDSGGVSQTDGAD